MKFVSLCIFKRRLRKKYKKKFFRVEKMSKNRHDLDLCFSGKLRKQVSCVIYF